MGGIFDWDEMKVVGRVEAGVYFWTFIVISSMILLNMLLAIVMDAYGAVKSQISSTSRPLWTEISLAVRRRYLERRKVLIPMKTAVSELRIEVAKLLEERQEAEEDGQHLDDKSVPLEFLNAKLLVK